MKIFDWQKINKEFISLYKKLEEKYSLYSKSTRALLDLIGDQYCRVFLDVGCGTGISTEEIYQSRRNLCNIVGIDISKYMLEEAKKRFINIGGVEFHELDVFKINKLSRISNTVKENGIDIAISNFTFAYFVNDPLSVINSIYDLLNNNGCFAFNITFYMRPLLFEGHLYNEYSLGFHQTLDDLLKREGINKIYDYNNSFTKKEDIIQLIDNSKFNSYNLSLFRLPTSPEDTLRFTYDVFIRFGLIPSFSQSLKELPLNKRIKLFDEATKRTISKMKGRKLENPLIVNVIAKK